MTAAISLAGERMRLWIKLGAFVFAFVVIALMIDQYRIRLQLIELIRCPLASPGVNEKIETLKTRCICMPPTLEMLKPDAATQPATAPTI